MPPADRLLAFALTAVVVIVVPGPSVLFIVARALAHGRRVALLTVAGNTVGEFAQVVAVAFGVGVVAERSVAAFTVLRLAGGAYLVYLGLRTFRRRHQLAGVLTGGPVAPPAHRAFREGVWVGATNPKTVVFLVAVLPGFTDRAAGHVPLQIMVLGAVFSAVALCCDSVWGAAAGGARTWLAGDDRRLAAVGGAGGLAIAVLGLRLAVTGRHD